MSTLYDDYGFIIFPKGFHLYHSSKDKLVLDKFHEKNYTIHTTIHYPWKFSDNIYRLTLLRDYKILFAFAALDYVPISGLIDIYNRLTGENYNRSSYDIFNSSKYSLQKYKLIEQLQNNNIYGYVTANEGKYYLDICLFATETDKYYNIEEIHIPYKFGYMTSSLDTYVPRIVIGTQVDTSSIHMMYRRMKDMFNGYIVADFCELYRILVLNK